MFPLFLTGIALTIGLFLLVHSFIHADPRVVARALRYTGIGVGTVVVIFLAITGRLGIALAIGISLLPVFLRRRLFGFRPRMVGGGAGQVSTIETQFLRMTLDHETNIMEGEVLHGPFQGRRLGEMALPELLHLLEECRNADVQSATVLETYLDRTRPENWREAAAGDGPGNGTSGSGGGGSSSGGSGAFGEGVMSREEAWRILDLEPGAAPEAIKEAHRRLMLKLHPDQGGSTYLAAKINQAKDLLLRT